MIRKYAEIFCWKNVSSFCIAKATHIFSAKNIIILYIESAKTVNEMTLNGLVKLTTLWTTGPCFLCHRYFFLVFSIQIKYTEQETRLRVYIGNWITNQILNQQPKKKIYTKYSKFACSSCCWLQNRRNIPTSDFETVILSYFEFLKRLCIGSQQMNRQLATESTASNWSL